MKSFTFLELLLLTTASITTSSVFAAAIPSLGSVAQFAVFTANGAVINSGPSKISGSIGADVSSTITGFPPGQIQGQQNVGNQITQQASKDLTAAVSQFFSLPCDYTTGPAFSGTLVPGVYCMAFDGGIPNSITLDAQGNSSAIFIFLVAGQFNIGDSTSVTLVNGVVTDNVYWITSGASSIGISAQFYGTLITHGDINMQYGATINGGRLLSTGGSISMSSNIVNVETSPIQYVTFVSEQFTTLQNSGNHQKTHRKKNLKTHQHNRDQHK